MPSNTACIHRIVAVVILAAACASGGTAGSPSPTAESAGMRRDRNVITADELAAPGLKALSVYDAIRSLRPNFLSNRGTQVMPGNDPEAGQVHASIDGMSVVSLDELKRLHVNGVIEIRLLSPAAAMQKFGATAREGPVILVRTM